MSHIDIDIFKKKAKKKKAFHRTDELYHVRDTFGMSQLHDTFARM